MRFTKQKKSELKGYRLHNSIGGKTVGTENKLVVARGMGEEAVATTEGTHRGNCGVRDCFVEN